MAKEEDLFNPAFKDLDRKLKRFQKAERESESEPPQTDEAKPDEEQSFLEAMSDVTPLPDMVSWGWNDLSFVFRQGGHI